MKAQYFIALMVACTCGSGSALAAPEIKDRFVLRKSGDSFVRMDTLTGVISVCSRTDNIWQCQIVKDDYASARMQIEKLQKQVKDLKQHGKVSDKETSQNRDLDKVLDAFEKMMQRFMRFSEDMKRAPEENL